MNEKAKKDHSEQTFVRKPQCERCGKPIIPLPPKMTEKIYGKEGDVKGLTRLCPECRRKVLWEGVMFRYERRHTE